METLVGHDISQLERLHIKCLVGSSLVIEKVVIPNSPSKLESSMDSAITPSSIGTTMLGVPSPTKSIVKVDSDSRKPPSSSAKVVLKGPSFKRKLDQRKLFLYVKL
ncbi:unnamed protein product [Lactuca saligna]|uniref:Uncharacterized protein n=1 Tax=Lactuca saligna TaxID=75948 RepID=A0AA36A4N8_LACSI|nr:unnamed protein product [Lactuca saligna]